VHSVSIYEPWSELARALAKGGRLRSLAIDGFEVDEDWRTVLQAIATFNGKLRSLSVSRVAHSVLIEDIAELIGWFFSVLYFPTATLNSLTPIPRKSSSHSGSSCGDLLCQIQYVLAQPSANDGVPLAHSRLHITHQQRKSMLRW
jgi:hypothetical protein